MRRTFLLTHVAMATRYRGNMFHWWFVSKSGVLSLLKTCVSVVSSEVSRYHFVESLRFCSSCRLVFNTFCVLGNHFLGSSSKEVSDKEVL